MPGDTAAVRTATNHKLVAEASAALGRKVTVREAVAWRKGANEDGTRHDQRRPEPPAPADTYIVEDRQVVLPPDQLRMMGSMLARVLDMKVIRGGVVQLSLQTSTDFAHLVTDASMVSRGHPLLVTLQEYVPPKREDADGDDDADGDG